MGAHQKLDRLARVQLRLLLGDANRHFPDIRTILRFEGNNGPDGIKRKSPAVDEPWHYINPKDDNDKELIGLIEGHVEKLTSAIRDGDKTRAGFESAWLAHAIVDGLTPAHHFPYEETLAELRGGQDKSTRTTIRKKIVLPGETPIKKVKNNWMMWGPKGLLTTHGSFEFGVSTIIAPFNRRHTPVTQADIKDLEHQGLTEIFRKTVREIDSLAMYEAFQRRGWTPRLARQVRLELAPAIVRVVTLAWYQAVKQSGVLADGDKK